MSCLRTPLLQTFRCLALLASVLALAAHADEYAEVSQLIRSGKLPQAMSRADQFLAAKPRDLKMRFFKGVIQRDSGRISEAIDTFARLTQDYPEQPEPYNNVAVLYANQNQFDKAVVALEMAIRTNPAYATAHENLGDVYAKLASQAYARSLQLDSSNQAIVPKLAHMRDAFNPATGKSQKTAPAAAGTPRSVALRAPTTFATPVMAANATSSLP